MKTSGAIGNHQTFQIEKCYMRRGVHAKRYGPISSLLWLLLLCVDCSKEYYRPLEFSGIVVESLSRTPVKTFELACKRGKAREDQFWTTYYQTEHKSTIIDPNQPEDFVLFTNDEGFFSLQVPEPGKYTLFVRAPGYELTRRTFDVNKKLVGQIQVELTKVPEKELGTTLLLNKSREEITR